jgi:glycosyltransferase involved in cell wall biosynthesis
MAKAPRGVKGKPRIAVVGEIFSSPIESVPPSPSPDIMATTDTHEEHETFTGEHSHGAPAAAQTEARQGLRGSIDKAIWPNVSGWAWDPKNPQKRIRLELVEGDSPIATTVAATERPDLATAGIGDGRHAFSIELKPGMLTDGPHTLQLRCTDTGAVVPGSPIVLNATSDSREAAFRSHLDQITDKEAAGWIVPRGGPLRHCVVALKEGGVVLARAVASEFRADLLSAGIGDGCYAFKLPMPRSLLDGEVHLLEIAEENTGFALAAEPIRWRSAAGTAEPGVLGPQGAPRGDLSSDSVGRRSRPDASHATRADGSSSVQPLANVKRLFEDDRSLGSRAAPQVRTRVLFDMSDLIYYIAQHPNLTGIQRVQSSIVLAMIDGGLLASSSIIFLSFNARAKTWVAIPNGFLISLLRDLFLPVQERLISFPAGEARDGILPGSQPFDGTGVLDDGNPSVLCLMGAAWVQQDYVHRVLAWKRRFGTRFVMTVHDLIPVYAGAYCDQDTTRVFGEFMRRALPHVDHVLAVSGHTAKDIRRYLTSLRIPEPPITITKNGSSFEEFLPKRERTGEITIPNLPERFVLFVATIEGRKNHKLIFDVWRQMIEEGEDPPHLVCVGRLGWKATAFYSGLVETDYLGGRVHLFREVSDTDLWGLYERCLFTVCPTMYEGWGLPVGESLAMGKICVCSDRASIPEVAGDCGVYINIDRPDEALITIRNLIQDEPARKELEAKIRRDYVPVTWTSVAERVVSACEAAVATQWQAPYPYAALPYGTEVSFGRLDQDLDGSGEPVLSRIVDARTGHYTHEPLTQASFLLGETLRGGGVWAQPERWGTWLCYGGGDVEFSLPADASQFDLVWLRVRVCDVLHEQPVRVVANGELVWAGPIGARSRDIMLRVRKNDSANGDHSLRIAVEVDLTPDLRTQIAALDGRLPTLGFERLIVVPENDVMARLEVLSHYVMSNQR